MRRERVVLLCLALLGLQQVSRATLRQSREIIITDAVGVPGQDRRVRMRMAMKRGWGWDWNRGKPQVGSPVEFLINQVSQRTRRVASKCQPPNGPTICVCISDFGVPSALPSLPASSLATCCLPVRCLWSVAGAAHPERRLQRGAPLGDDEGRICAHPAPHPAGGSRTGQSAETPCRLPALRTLCLIGCVRSIVNHIPNGYFRLQKIRIIGRSQC